MKVKAEIMSQDQMRRALKRMSHEILERNSGAANIVLIGILRRGKPLAETIRDNILQIEGVEVPVILQGRHFRTGGQEGLSSARPGH